MVAEGYPSRQSETGWSEGKSSFAVGGFQETEPGPCASIGSGGLPYSLRHQNPLWLRRCRHCRGRLSVRASPDKLWCEFNYLVS